MKSVIIAKTLGSGFTDRYRRRIAANRFLLEEITLLSST